MSSTHKSHKKQTGTSGSGKPKTLSSNVVTEPLPIKQTIKSQKQQETPTGSGAKATPVLKELNEFKPQTPSPRFRRREIVSNWSRYEIDDNENEENTNIADFNELLEASSKVILSNRLSI
jgi:hypothetical protein